MTMDAPGSIGRERQRDGSIRYRVRVRVEGVRQSHGLYRTIEEAEEALDARERSGRVRGHAKEASCWRAHVAGSDLAALPLTRIRRQHVVAWLDALSARMPRLALGTIRHARRLVIGALEDAVDAGRITSNPARGARIRGRDERTEPPWTWLTVDELARVLALPVHDPPSRVAGGRIAGTITSAQRSAIVVAIYAGLRAGELWGLRWRDAHLDGPRPMLVVGRSREAATKSGIVREVPLLEPARAALERWREVAPGVGDALVWPASDGACHRDGYDAGWPRVLRLAGIARRVRLHDLRHTCTSHLVQGTWGRVWSLAEVRTVLGHGSVRLTERYAHLCPGGIHDAARATSGALPSGQPRASVLTLSGRSVELDGRDR